MFRAAVGHTVAEQQVRIPRSEVRCVRAHGEHVASRRRIADAPVVVPHRCSSVLRAHGLLTASRELNDRSRIAVQGCGGHVCRSKLDRSKSPREISRSRSNESPTNGLVRVKEMREKRKAGKVGFPPEIVSLLFLIAHGGASDGARRRRRADTARLRSLVFCYIRITLCECAIFRRHLKRAIAARVRKFKCAASAKILRTGGDVARFETLMRRRTESSSGIIRGFSS